MAKKKTKQTNPKRAALTAIAIAAAVVAMLALILWLCRPGPLDKVASAAENTLFAENFTANFLFDINGQNADGTINAAIDRDNKQLSMYMKLTTNVSDYECGIYNNSLVICRATDGDISSVDITDRVENFFAALEYGGQPDWSVLLDLEGTDLHETLAKDFDFDVFLSCLGNWLDKMNDTGWAKQHAGYSKEKLSGITTYRYSPDPYTLATQTAPMFKKAFLEPQRYQDLLDYMDNARYRDGKADISFGVRGGCLVAVDFDLQYHKTDISGSIQFSGIGTTTVDTSTVNSYIQQSME